MKHLSNLNRWLCTVGLDFSTIFRSSYYLLRGLPLLLREYSSLISQNKRETFSNDIQFMFPVVTDRYQTAGTAKGGYFYQDLYVAQAIFSQKPAKHVDVASRVDGFVAHVAAFRDIEVFDIRPLNSSAKNIVFRQGDLMNLDPTFYHYTDSLSCLHALEHFGLGRYGDPVNLHGYRNGFDSLYNMLKQGGTLYLSVPIGHQRVEFNAHRVFAIDTILNLAKLKLSLTKFSYVDPMGDFFEDTSPETCQRLITHTWSPAHYGLGIFEFKKI